MSESEVLTVAWMLTGISVQTIRKLSLCPKVYWFVVRHEAKRSAVKMKHGTWNMGQGTV
ncbi:MAG: hypothetical protein NZ781_11335 [Armatimonadetes bacterium]|nr:hypothetical protein [Armatimonadota bacterium]